MEEFKEDSKAKMENGNKLQLDTERSSVDEGSEEHRYKGDHLPVWNDTIETFDDEAGK